MEATMTMPEIKLEKRSGLSYEEFQNNYLFPLKPVVFTDAAKDWKAVGKFTPEFFKRNFLEIPIELSIIIKKGNFFFGPYF